MAKPEKANGATWAGK